MEKLQFSEIQLTHFVEKVLKGYMVEGGLQKRERFLAEGLLWVDSRMEKPFGKDEIRGKSEGAKHVFIETKQVAALGKGLYTVFGRLKADGLGCKYLAVVSGEEAPLLLQLHLTWETEAFAEKQFAPFLPPEEQRQAKRTALDSRIKSLEEIDGQVPAGVIQCRNDEAMSIRFFSDGFCRLFGYTREEMERRMPLGLTQLACPADREAMRAKLSRQLTHGKHVELVFRFLKKDGSNFWLLCRGQKITEEDGSAALYCILVDVSDTKQASVALERREERYRLVSEQADEIIFEFSYEQQTVIYTSTFYKKFGYEPSVEALRNDEAKNRLIHPEDALLLDRLVLDIHSGRDTIQCEMRMRRQDGQYIWCMIQVGVLRDAQGRPLRILGKVTDIDRQKAEWFALLDKAQRDCLTGLYNKATTNSRIEEYLRREGMGKHHALLIIDVDNFKKVNDTLGHLQGDAVIQALADKLHSVFRNTDVIGRIGGDEFLVLIKDLPDDYSLAEKVSELMRVFRLRCGEGERQVTVSSSIGVARYPEDGSDFLELFRHADSALYHMKKNGKNGYCFYRP